MCIEYFAVRTIDQKEEEAVLQLYTKIFDTERDIWSSLLQREDPLICLAKQEERIVGFKMGYALNEHSYYSWLGGVDRAFRQRGIASTLMKLQHDELLKRGYRTVQTKTSHRWNGMLILNLKMGYEIVNLLPSDRKDVRHRIVLEKKLT